MIEISINYIVLGIILFAGSFFSGLGIYMIIYYLSDIIDKIIGLCMLILGLGIFFVVINSYYPMVIFK